MEQHDHSPPDDVAADDDASLFAALGVSAQAQEHLEQHLINQVGLVVRQHALPARHLMTAAVVLRVVCTLAPARNSRRSQLQRQQRRHHQQQMEQQQHPLMLVSEHCVGCTLLLAALLHAVLGRVPPPACNRADDHTHCTANTHSSCPR
jgi:7-keto-8-aminopelargonate synthetase-like enzyme